MAVGRAQQHDIRYGKRGTDKVTLTLTLTLPLTLTPTLTPPLTRQGGRASSGGSHPEQPTFRRGVQPRRTRVRARVHTHRVRAAGSVRSLRLSLTLGLTMRLTLTRALRWTRLRWWRGASRP